MPTTIDELQIEINAKAKSANKAIDSLVGRLDILSKSLGKINNAGYNLSELANGVQKLGISMQAVSYVKTTDFTRLAKNLEKLAGTNAVGLNTTASSLFNLTRAFGGLGSVSENANNIGLLSANLAKLGGKRIEKAAENIPLLANSLKKLMATLSTAPIVSDNVIQMTNALANLVQESLKVGVSSQSVEKGLNRTANSSQKAKTSVNSLARSFGMFYANYFLFLRAIKGAWGSIETTSDYVESFNYFTVAMGKVASKWDKEWSSYADENARNYSNKFFTTLDSTFKKLSGVSYDPKTGLLSETGLKNLGLNLQEVTQYAAQLGSMMDAVGQSGETTLATTNAFVKLAGDISSLFNIDYSEASEKIRSVLQGQSRAGYAFGWDTTAAALETTAKKYNITKAVSEMSQMEKQQLRILTILEQSRVAWGDQANTINTVANQIRIFKNNLKEIGMVFGQLFIPLLQRVLPYLNGLSIAIKRLLSDIGGLMGIKIEDIGQGFGDMSDDLEDVAESAQKAKASLRGFDELKTISMPNNQGESDALSNQIDLSKEIAEATKEYEEYWSKALEGMENRAEEIADKFEKAFQPIKKLFKNISSGKWFDVGQDTSTLTASILTFFSDAIDSVDWKEVGNKIGSYLSGIDWEKIIKEGFKLTFNLGEAIADLWFETFNVAPIETALLTAIGTAKFTGLSKVLKDAVTASLGIVGGQLTIPLIISAVAIGFEWKIGGEREELEKNIEELGEEAGRKVSGTGFLDRQALLRHDIEKSTNEINQIYADFFLTLDDRIVNTYKKWRNKIKKHNQNTQIANEELKTAYTELFDSISGFFSNWFNNDVKPWFTKEKWSGLATNIKDSISEEWDKFLKWWDNTGFKKWYNERIVPWFAKDKWSFSGIKDGLSTAFDNAISAVKRIWNRFAEWLNEKLTWTIDPIQIGGTTLFGGTTINLGKIPTFQTGGFPEDGLFMANHNELIGEFTNGKNVVINNKQITQGIADAVYPAVYNAVTAAFSNKGTEPIRVFVGDRELTDIVVDGINQRTRAGKQPLFGW